MSTNTIHPDTLNGLLQLQEHGYLLPNTDAVAAVRDQHCQTTGHVAEADAEANGMNSSDPVAPPTKDNLLDTSLRDAWPEDRVAFTEQGHLSMLNLATCRLHRGWKCSFDVFSLHFSHLETLCLGGTDLPTTDTFKILQSLPNLTTVHLGGNSLGGTPTGVQELCAWLSTNLVSQPLIKLDVRYNDLGAQGMHALCKVLPKSLEYLYVEGNSIGDDGAMALAQVLQQDDCKLQSVFLGANQIRVDGAMALAKTLETNKTLVKLYLEGNQIGPEGASSFSQVLETLNGDTGLKHLFVDNNAIGKEGSQRLAAALQSETAIGGALGDVQE